MTKNEIYKIRAHRCKYSKRMLLNALLIFFEPRQILHYDEEGCFKIPKRALVGYSNLQFNYLNRLARYCSVQDTIDDIFLSFYY